MRKLLALALTLVLITGGAWLAAVLQRPIPVPDYVAVEDIATASQAEIAATYPEAASLLVRRSAHAKGHGCVKAIFRTDSELPNDLRVGTFAVPGQPFKAMIRYSNGALHVVPDSLPDGRGMAIKLMDSDPDKPGAARGRPPHDILLVNYPEFFGASTPDFHSFVRANGLRGGAGDLKAYFQPGWNPFNWRLVDAKIAFANATQPIESPLRSDYFSMTPYAFGAGRTVKYAARPCTAAANVPALPHEPDYLHKALVSELAAAPACFELLVQEQPPAIDLEDAREEWKTPLRRVGRIDIPAQSVNAPGKDAACENLSFNPARAPAEQAPVGGLNRMRAFVYAKIAAYRLQRNNAIPTDPERAWDGF